MSQMNLGKPPSKRTHVAVPGTPTVYIPKGPGPQVPVVLPPIQFTLAEANPNRGERFVIYGPSGTGKSSLAAMASYPIFLDFDHTSAGLPVKVQIIQGLDSFAHVQAALKHPGLFPAGSTVVIDTGTKLYALTEPYILETVPKDVHGSKAKSIEDFGYGKGYTYLQEHIRSILCDLEKLSEAGHNIVVLVQQGPIKVATADGVEVSIIGPKLGEKANAVSMELSAWADHVIRVGYSDEGTKALRDDGKGKKVSTETGAGERCLYTRGTQRWVAKTRYISGQKLPEVVAFASETDNTLWSLLEQMKG